VGKTSTSHAGDKVCFEFDGILGDRPSFVEWENSEPLRIGCIQPIPCDLMVLNAAEVRVAIRNELDEVVSGSFGAGSDDMLWCKRPVQFDGKIKAEVSGPKGQRARFALKGKLVPKDEL
jgi:hypothetical protein